MMEGMAHMVFFFLGRERSWSVEIFSFSSFSFVVSFLLLAIAVSASIIWYLVVANLTPVLLFVASAGNWVCNDFFFSSELMLGQSDILYYEDTVGGTVHVGR